SGATGSASPPPATAGAGGAKGRVRPAAGAEAPGRAGGPEGALAAAGEPAGRGQSQIRPRRSDPPRPPQPRFPGGSMPRKFKKKVRRRKPGRRLLYVPQILAWANDHHRRTGAWPTRAGGWVDGTADEKWMNVDVALRAGRRGLRPGSSLARLLAAH